jgi:hypothetical protein
LEIALRQLGSRIDRRRPVNRIILIQCSCQISGFGRRDAGERLRVALSCWTLGLAANLPEDGCGPSGNASIKMNIKRDAVLKRGLVIALSASLLLEPGCTPENGTTAEAPSVPPAASAPQAATEFNAEQLDAMLASIALYPDDLLVQMLMASTYPLQIVEARRWVDSGSNKDLKGEALAQALAPLPWDPSVKSLVPFPQVLAQMDQHLDWTQQIGYAMATQQADVLDSVQRLRRQAQSAGTLKTTEQQVVSTSSQTDAEGQPLPNQTIVIQPANPQTVYVPVYDPIWAYGAGRIRHIRRSTIHPLAIISAPALRS